MVDQGTGLWAALAIVAALHERERTGGGRTIDVSLYETTLALLSYQLTGYLGSGEILGRHGTAFASIAPYRVYDAQDGELMIAAGNDRLFRTLAGVLDIEGVVDDPRFRTNPDCVAHRGELDGIIEQAVASWQTTALLEALERAGVPAAPVHDVAQVATHPQTEALDILRALPHHRVPDLRTVALPVSIDGERVGYHTPPPDLGADTEAVLLEAGYSAAEIRSLVDEGIVSVSP
jgi:formyl-CoA transferase/CoA:oxalate CoA-transferase